MSDIPVISNDLMVELYRIVLSKIPGGSRLTVTRTGEDPQIMDILNGLKIKGKYVSGTEYALNDLVYESGSGDMYLSLADENTAELTDDTAWRRASDAEKAVRTAIEALINDGAASESAVWSSTKVNEMLAGKQPSGNYATTSEVAEGLTAETQRATAAEQAITAAIANLSADDVGAVGLIQISGIDDPDIREMDAGIYQSDTVINLMLDSILRATIDAGTLLDIAYRDDMQYIIVHDGRTFRLDDRYWTLVDVYDVNDVYPDADGKIVIDATDIKMDRSDEDSNTIAEELIEQSATIAKLSGDLGGLKFEVVDGILTIVYEEENA